MHALTERGTYRSFTDADLDRLGVPEATMRGFMQLVLMHLCEPASTFYPIQEPHADTE